MVDKIRRRRLTWFGHVSRIDERRLPSRAVHCHIKGRRKTERSPKKWIDNITEADGAQYWRSSKPNKRQR